MTDLIQKVSNAINLVTRLRTISEKTRDSEFKGLVANVLLELAEIQLKLDEILNENITLKGQLDAKSNPQGERCPRCQELGWKVTSSRPQKSLGQSPRILQTYSCPKCGLKEEVVVAPK
jgi:uncharacterized protein with PIN domain